MSGGVRVNGPFQRCFRERSLAQEIREDNDQSQYDKSVMSTPAGTVPDAVGQACDPSSVFVAGDTKRDHSRLEKSLCLGTPFADTPEPGVTRRARPLRGAARPPGNRSPGSPATPGCPGDRGRAD